MSLTTDEVFLSPLGLISPRIPWWIPRRPAAPTRIYHLRRLKTEKEHILFLSVHVILIKHDI